MNYTYDLKIKPVCFCALYSAWSNLNSVKDYVVSWMYSMCVRACIHSVYTGPDIYAYKLESADTSRSVLQQDPNPICSLYVQLKHHPGILFCVPIIFLQMFLATFLQCTLLSHSSYF